MKLRNIVMLQAFLVCAAPAVTMAMADIVEHGSVADGMTQMAPNIADDKGTTETENKAAFVDKDGDGINDGKEQRFRRKDGQGTYRERRLMLRKRQQSGKSGGNGGRRNHNPQN